MSKDNYKILISLALQKTFLFVLKMMHIMNASQKKKHLVPIFKITRKLVTFQPK